MFVSLTTIVGLGRFFTILQMTSETNDQQIFVLLCAAQCLVCTYWYPLLKVQFSLSRSHVTTHICAVIKPDGLPLLNLYF